MSTKNLSKATLSGFLAMVVGLIVLAGCGGGSSGGTTTTPTGTPAVTVTGSTLVGSTLTFSSAVGVTSAAQTLTLTDSGTANVSFSSFSASSGYSVIATLCGTGIAEGGACTITVTFTPTAGGTTSGSLSIVDNAGTQTITLTGTGGVPTVSVTPANLSLTFASQSEGTSSASQMVTLNNTGTVPLSITSIASSANFGDTTTCTGTLAAGSNCTISVVFTPTATGALTGTLTIADNAASNTTVSLSGTGTSTSSVSLTSGGVGITSLTYTGVTVGNSSTAQVVTLNNTGASTLTITSISVTAGSTNFSDTTTCGSTVLAGATCTINVTFTPQAGGTLTGTLSIVDSGGTQTLSLTGSGLANTVPVQINFGINGYTGPPSTTQSAYYNGIFTSVTVCAPGTTTCTTIPNVLVDTGSVGLRVLSSGISGISTQVSSLNLPQVYDPSSSYPLYECVQYGDLSYTWGPMQMATVSVGGETASTLPGAAANTGIPIQVISEGVNPPASVYYEGEPGYINPCESAPGTSGEELSGGINDNSATLLGANGILGVGNFAQDCGIDCASEVYGSYLICQSVGSTVCEISTAQVADQAWNPVAAFPADNNGVSLQLPSVPAGGELTATGTLIFGIGTENNNGLNGATAYELDQYGDFNSAVLNNVTYTSTNSGGTFIDSGSNAFYVSDAGVLSTSDCYQNDIVNINNDLGWYCPSSPLTPQLQLTGTNSTSTTVTLNIANATNLFAANTQFAVFNNLGGPSCIAATNSPCTAATDYFDLGLPFFFGQPHGLFVGIAGATTGTPDYANGYWAF